MTVYFVFWGLQFEIQISLLLKTFFFGNKLNTLQCTDREYPNLIWCSNKYTRNHYLKLETGIPLCEAKHVFFLNILNYETTSTTKEGKSNVFHVKVWMNDLELNYLIFIFNFFFDWNLKCKLKCKQEMQSGNIDLEWFSKVFELFEFEKIK